MSRLAPCVAALLLSVTARAEFPDVMVPSWTRLVFETSKPIAAVRIELRLAPLAREGPSAAIYLLSSTVSSDANWPLPDTEFRGGVRFRRSDGSVLERVREKITGGRYRKTFTFTEDAVTRVTLRPDGWRERRRSPEDWSDRSERRFSHPADLGGCDSIADPTLLLLVASSPRLASGEAGVDLCVFNKKRIHRVRLRRVGSEQIEIRERTISARRIEIRATPLEGPFSPEPLELLGLEGDFEILIDEETNVPVSLRGQVDVFGRADFRLTELECSGPAS